MITINSLPFPSIDIEPNRTKPNLANPVPSVLLCPSSLASDANAQVFAISAGTNDKPEIIYLDETLPASEEVFKLAEPVAASEVFRFAAPCASHCAHNNSGTCQLADKFAHWVPGVSENLPRCAIRSECKWWHQEGPKACRRCSVMVTLNFNRDESLNKSANPEVIRVSDPN